MSFKLPDFDTMLNLAENSPQELERLRRAAIEEVIGNAPIEIQRRLRGLQFQIDAQRAIAKNPLASCIKISEMMHESFAKLRSVLNAATGQRGTFSDYPQITEDELPPLAKVIPFKY